MFSGDVLRRLIKEINRVRSEIKGSWKLLHENAPNHTAFVVRDYLTRIGVATAAQPPYSPDLAPPDFFLLPKVTEALKGRHLDTNENIKTISTMLLKGIPAEDFQGACNAWVSHWK